MRAYRQTAAIGCAFAGLILGSLTGDLTSLAAGRSVTMNLSVLPWWFDATIAAVALVTAALVAHWLLRVTSVAFAAARVASIAAVAQALSIGAAVLFGLHAIFASTLMLAAWLLRRSDSGFDAPQVLSGSSL
jgi:hypothetical protein